MCLSKLNQTNPVEINFRNNERSSIAYRDSSFSSFDTDNTIRSSGTSSTTRSTSQNQKPSSRKLKNTRIATPTLAKNEPSIRSSYLHKLGVISDSDRVVSRFAHLHLTNLLTSSINYLTDLHISTHLHVS